MRSLLLAKHLLAGALLVFATLASAEPSIDDVYKAANSGNLPQAEAMMTEVLRAHPDSAKAHFIHAEILAKANRINEAREELSRAEAIQPGLSFMKPAAVDHLKQRLHSSGGNAGAAGKSSGASFWMWGGLIVMILAIVMVVRSLGRRANPNYGYGQTGYNPQNYGNNPPMPGGPGYPYPPQGGGMGSNIMSGLATGAAVGAGVVAGEALMRNILDDHPQQTEEHHYANQPASDNYDMGGNDFGVSDNSSWDDPGSSWSDNSSGGDSGDWT